MDPPPIQDPWGAFMNLQPFSAPLNTQYAQVEPQTLWHTSYPPVGEQNDTRKYTGKDWDAHRLEITELYENGTLDNVIKSMRTRHGLEATPKQYKDRFKKWKLNKYVLADEMKAMIRIQRIRASSSQKPKETAFRVRKQPFAQEKIDRYIKEHPIQSLGVISDNVDGDMSTAATPSVVSYYTPSNTGPLSPEQAPFSYQSPLSAAYQFGDPAPLLLNSPSVTHISGSFQIRSPSQISIAASPAPSSSSLIELEESKFTGRSPAPFSVPSTPKPQNHDILQYGAMALMCDDGDLLAKEIDPYEDNIAQSHYNTSSPFQHLFLGDDPFLDYPGSEGDVCGITSVVAVDPTGMRLSEVHAAMLLSIDDILIIDQYQVASKQLDALYRRHELAAALYDQGRYETAGQMHLLTLELRQKVLGPKHPDTLESMHGLALAVRRQGKYKTAEQIYRQTVQLWQGKLPLRHPSTLKSMHGLAVVLNDQGKHQIAEQMHQRTLKLRRELLGSRHPETLESMRELAVVLYSQGRYKNAEQAMRQALDGCRDILGEEHIDTLQSTRELALVLLLQGRYETAKRMMRRALDGCEKVLGKQHPDTIESMLRFATCFHFQGMYKIAERMMRQALDAFKKVLGKEHPATLTSLHGLANVLRAQGNYKAAEDMHRRALEGMERVLGMEHPETLISVWCLASLLPHRKRYSDSVILYQRASVGFQKILGLEHPNTISCLKDYTSTVEDMRRENQRW